MALLCVARDYDRLHGGLFYFGVSGGVFVVVWVLYPVKYTVKEIR